MAKKETTLRVHLDHFITRQSLRYVEEDSTTEADQQRPMSPERDHKIRYEDILRSDGWFNRVRKPDFQRETNAWTPEDCVGFIDSVVNGRIIPSIILWQSQDNDYVYVLDGAHRLSVLKAWMIDDWGDNAGDYYERRDKKLVEKAAVSARDLVNLKVGSFEEYKKAADEISQLNDQGEAPLKVMDQRRYMQGKFYNNMIRGMTTLYSQWEQGGYETAESSFLRINQGGQALDPWEAMLIEYRNSSYARVIMSIANGGESGHYWPNPKVVGNIDQHLAETVKSFGEKASGIHTRLFVPPFDTPISTLSVPLMVTPEYFQKHKHLLEVIPLIAYRNIAKEQKDQISLMKEDLRADPAEIIKNSNDLLTDLEKRLDHLISPANSSRSLSIVPLFYFYNDRGGYARGLFYGFIYWLLAGTDNEITQRKTVFASQRDRFEDVLYNLKPEIAKLQERGGAGLKGVRKTSLFFNDLVRLLSDNPDLQAGSDELYDAVLDLLGNYATIHKRSSRSKKSRSYSGRDKSQINIRKLWESAIRCHICGGVVNLAYGGLQYDHVQDYAYTQVTDPETGEPTHPFCNLKKKQILANRSGRPIVLPSYSEKAEDTSAKARQMGLFDFWGEDNFPT